MRGGMVPFKGAAAAAARSYLSKDASVMDDYFLEAGELIATRHILDGAGDIMDRSVLDGDSYEAWAGWVDPDTGESRGLVRSGDERASTIFLDKIVNVDKTLSVAAILDDRIAEQLDLAMSAASDEMLSYIAQNVRTRVGSRGHQKWIPVERFEAVTVAHRTSREGDPHRHLHVQLLNRVYAEGSWRSLHTASLLKINEAMNRLAEGVLNSHAGLQDAIAAAGYTVNPETGAIVELGEVAERMSKRRAQIAERTQELVAAWEVEHPGQTPGKAVLEDIDHRAWAETRREKTPATMSTVEAWREEIAATGFTPPTGPVERIVRSLADVDADAVVQRAVARLEAGESAWSLARMTAAIAHELDVESVDAQPRDFSAAVDALTRQAVANHCRLLEPGADLYALPAHLKMLTTEGIEREERDLKGLLLTTSLEPVTTRTRTPDRDIILDAHSDMDQQDIEAVLGGTDIDVDRLGEGQKAALRVLAGTSNLVVITGAAGAGKTTLLKASSAMATARISQQVIVAPSAKAAAVAHEETGDRTATVHKLLHDYGYRWTTDPSTGATTWRRLAIGEEGYAGVPPERALPYRSQLVIDEAGMLSQDVTVRLLQVAQETHSRVVLTGDHAQLGAVGRGGVLQLAQTSTTAYIDLNQVHRFRDAEYASLSLQMRERLDPGEQFDQLRRMGLIRLHDSAMEAQHALARTWEEARYRGEKVVIAASTNEQTDAINTKILLDPSLSAATPFPVTGADGNPVTAGALIMCRRNDNELRVMNRQTLTVLALGPDYIRVQETIPDGRVFSLPHEYVREHTHLGYAVTTHAAQGITVTDAHMLLTDQTDAAGLYVGMTRGRASNTLHIVASDYHEAREQYQAAISRDRADTGLDQARRDLATQLEGMDLPQAPKPPEPQTPRRPGEAPAFSEIPASDLRPGHVVGLQDGTRYVLIGVTPQRDGILRQYAVPEDNPAAAPMHRDVSPTQTVLAGPAITLPPAPDVLPKLRANLQERINTASEAITAAEHFLQAVGDPAQYDELSRQRETIERALREIPDQRTALSQELESLEKPLESARLADLARLRADVLSAQRAADSAGIFTRGRAQRALQQSRQALQALEATPVAPPPAAQEIRTQLEALDARQKNLTASHDALQERLELPNLHIPARYGRSLHDAADIPRAHQIMEAARRDRTTAIQARNGLQSPGVVASAATWMLHHDQRKKALNRSQATPGTRPHTPGILPPPGPHRETGPSL